MPTDPPPSHAPTPGWVKAFFAVLGVLVAIFIGLHLAGLGLGRHMHGG